MQLACVRWWCALGCLSARAAAGEVGLSIEDRKYGLHVMYQHYDMMEPRGMLF